MDIGTETSGCQSAAEIPKIGDRTGRIEGLWTRGGFGRLGALEAVDAGRLWTPGGCGRREAADAGRLRTPGGCGRREAVAGLDTVAAGPPFSSPITQYPISSTQ
jgi:hypothetical protein